MSLHEINPHRDYTPDDRRIYAELAVLKDILEKEKIQRTGSYLIRLDRKMFGYSVPEDDNTPEEISD